MEKAQTVLFFPDAEVQRLLADNGIRLDQALAEHGIKGVQLGLEQGGDQTSREPVTAIIVASTVAITALGAAISQVIRSLASKPQTVRSEYVVVGQDGQTFSAVEERLVQPTVQQTTAKLETNLPFGIKVAIHTGGNP